MALCEVVESNQDDNCRTSVGFKRSNVKSQERASDQKVFSFNSSLKISRVPPTHCAGVLALFSPRIDLRVARVIRIT